VESAGPSPSNERRQVGTDQLTATRADIAALQQSSTPPNPSLLRPNPRQRPPSLSGLVSRNSRAMDTTAASISLPSYASHRNREPRLPRVPEMIAIPNANTHLMPRGTLGGAYNGSSSAPSPPSPTSLLPPDDTGNSNPIGELQPPTTEVSTRGSWGWIWNTCFSSCCGLEADAEYIDEWHPRALENNNADENPIETSLAAGRERGRPREHRRQELSGTIPRSAAWGWQPGDLQVNRTADDGSGSR
jgi:hypothetical protein